jgi:hypothetical protein
MGSLAAAPRGSGDEGAAGKAIGPGLAWSLGLGPQAGLDSFLRGFEASASLGLAWQGWGPSLSASIAWDRSLGSARGTVGLELDLGPDLAFELGWEYGLGGASFTEPESGALIALESSGLLSRLGLTTRLAELAKLGGGGLAMKAKLSWSAYRVVSIEGLSSSSPEGKTALMERLAGRQGFSAGFRAGLFLSWSGPAGGGPE